MLFTIFKDWSQLLFGSFEITSITLYTPLRNPLCGLCKGVYNLIEVIMQVTQVCVQPDLGYFEWTEQIISINPYKLIQTFLVHLAKGNVSFCHHLASVVR
jgi:hypothetical protein